MSRYTGPSCRLCRREGTKLFLKGTKCFTEKCPVERRAVSRRASTARPTARRRKASEYSKQLREKQKIKRIYGLTEQQFRNTFERRDAASPASRAPTCSSRSRAGWTTSCTAWASPSSRKAARQLIAPPPRRGERPAGSTSRATGSRRARKCASRRQAAELVSVKLAQEAAVARPPLSWLAVDTEKAAAAACSSARPATRIPIAAQEQLIVELYSK